MLPFCHVTLRGHKPYPPGYPRSLKTIGDHIKKRRLDLKFLQKELAERIGVDKTTVQFWENNRAKPSLSLIPKIIGFLGYNPFETLSNSLREQIKAFRQVHGLSQKRLAKLLRIDPTTVGSWERGENRPTKRNLDNLLSFLSSHPSSSTRPEE